MVIYTYSKSKKNNYICSTKIISDMNREILINRTISNISLLPDLKLKEISDYVDFLLKTYDNKKMTEGIMELTSKSFEFLNEEEEIYDVSDLIEKF